MSRRNGKVADRFLAILLSVMLVVAMLPSACLQTTAATADYPNSFTISVTDGTDPVEGATVTLEAKETEWSLNLSADTDSSGVAAFSTDDIEQALTDATMTSGTITYTVSKTGYDNSSGEVPVTTPDGLAVDSTVTLTKAQTTPQQYTLSVTVSGGGAVVKLNGEEKTSITVDENEEVSVEITPTENSYIKSLEVAGEAKTVAKGEAYSDTITVDKNIAISLEVVKEYTVTLKDNPEGGIITLDGNEASSVTIDENATVVLAVTADAGYQISSVSIGGVIQTITDVTSFSSSINVTADTEVIVSFIKVYTITVTHTENGTVVTEPVTVGGSVTVESGKKVTITADPDTNYRVSEVVINNEPDTTITGENYGDTDKYVKELTADRDYTVVITFAPNRYEVTKSDTEHGEIGLSAGLVDYDGSCEVTVTPDEGYSVSSVLVNGVSVVDYEENEEGVITFTINNIQAATAVSATFVQTATISSDIAGLFNNTDAIRVDGMTFIYAKDGTVTFTTDKTGIRIYNENNRIVAGGKDEQTFTLNGSVTISKIQLRYKADGEWTQKWHDVEGVSAQQLLKLVFDQSPTNSIVMPDEKHSDGFYNNDFSVGIKATDKGDYSGIGKIEYFVTDTKIDENITYAEVAEELRTQSGVLYTHSGSIQDVQTAAVLVDVEENKNNSDYVTVWFKITDLAGNVEYVRTENYLVNCSVPVLNSVTIDGTLHSEAKAGFYNNKRTATIVITDRASSFDEAAATNGISIEAKNLKGESITISKPAMVHWNSAGDVHTATITFDTDANYTWEVSYVNLAGKSLDKSAVAETGDSIYAFAIDRGAPGKASISFDAEHIYDELLKKLTFNKWDKYSITATATAEDEISPIYDVLYYKSDAETVLQEADLEVLYGQGEFVTANYTISAEQKFVIYARITDYAGNTLYISTKGAIFDTTHSGITIQPEPANEKGFYNQDVKVDIAVSEIVEGHNVYSGIKTIDYRIEDDGVKTQEGNLYTFDIEDPSYEQLKDTWRNEPDQPVIVKAGTGEGENNSDHVKIIVTVVDNAGNEYSEEKTIAINVDEMSASIEMDGEGKVVDGYGYFSMEKRTATITLKDRASSFNEKKATEGILISAKDKEGKVIDNAYSISWSSDGDVHKAVVTFHKNAIYEWSFQYTNDADNELESITTGDSVAPFKFILDNTPPEGTVTVNENSWNRLLKFLTFGLYSKTKADISVTATDNISPIVVEYYMTSNPVAMSAAELDNVTFTAYEDFSVSADEQFVIYLKITDYAGNYTYISSDGYIVDKAASTITLTPSSANGFYNADANANGEYGLYSSNSEVTVDIKVEDAEPYSGIKSVEYWVVNNNVETQRATLYSYEYIREAGDGNGENTNGGTLLITDWNSDTQQNTAPVSVSGKHPTQEELTRSWSGKIVVDKALNNSCDVVVYVKTVDNAGNENIQSVKLDIDIICPDISVTFDNGNDNNGNTYFNAQRVATVVITERNHHFDADAATAGIVINAVDAEGKAVENAYNISGWTTAENTENPDATTHTAVITFAKDANYTWSISYTDKAGNANSGVHTSVTTGASVAAFAFTVDTEKPTGTIKAVSAEGRETEWNTLRDELSFGFWSNDRITLSGTYDDLTSAQVYSIEYYKVQSTAATDGTTALTAAQLDAVTGWTALSARAQTNADGTYYAYDGFTVSTDEQFTVYVKLTDMAGNYTYISTNGLIVDHTAPLEETIAPEVSIIAGQSNNGIYRGDVPVNITVTDPLVGGTYSGLSSIGYRVLNMGTETQSGVLFTFSNENPKQSELVQTWTGSITVDSGLNNSNDVRIVVYARDNSLNTSEGEVAVKIDTTAPTIDVSYDNNAADTEKYFKENRTATIVVTERNFNAEDVRIEITNTDGTVPSIGEWTKTEGTGNQDNTKWSAKVVYSADGDYTFDIAYTDLAGNQCTGVSYGDSVAPTEFTVDKTIPVISVGYSNNNASNGNYFAEARTATVTITEHNFDADRVVFKQSASLNGSNIAIPAVSWSDRGDVHTATIVYSADGDYTFDVTMTDMAGNESGEAYYGNSVAGKDFVIDQTIEKPVISGVENGKAYTGDVIPAISFNDVNYASYEVTLLRTRMGNKNEDVTEEFIKSVSEQAQGGSGTYDSFEKIVENDGIYTLIVKMTDKAGNEGVEEITFTVNRFGSVYVYSDYLISLIKDGGQYITISGDNQAAITDDLVITEYNADRLLANSLKILVTRDGEALDAEYTVNPGDMNTEVTTGESGWYEYVYSIKAANFAEDGVYKISLTSAYGAEDSEKNESTSVPENSIDENGNAVLDTMKFTVDTTAPEIRNIVNLDARIPDVDKIVDNRLKVSYTVVDVGGLKSVEILINGEVYETITEFEDGGFNYSGSFDIQESNNTAAQTVRMVVTDLAGNVTDTSDEAFDTKDMYVFNDEIIVSRNFFVRWYANTALFYGSIGGTVAVLGAAGYFITMRRRRKVK